MVKFISDLRLTYTNDSVTRDDGGNAVPRLAAYYGAVNFTTLIAAWREEVFAIGDEPCGLAGGPYRDTIEHFSIIETVAKLGTDLQAQLLTDTLWRICDGDEIEAELEAIRRGSDFYLDDERVAAPALRKFASSLVSFAACLWSASYLIPSSFHSNTLFNILILFS